MVPPGIMYSWTAKAALNVDCKRFTRYLSLDFRKCSVSTCLQLAAPTEQSLTTFHQMSLYSIPLNASYKSICTVYRSLLADKYNSLVG